MAVELWDDKELWSSKANARMLTDAIKNCRESTKNDLAVNLLAQMSDSLEASAIREIDDPEKIREILDQE
jgi:hypothetical protein